MGAGILLILIILILCSSILFGIYMACCFEKGIKMFEKPNYENRIRKLEKQMEELKKE